MVKALTTTTTKPPELWSFVITANGVMVLVTQSCLTLCDPTDCSPPRLLCLWDSPGENTGLGCHALLQGIYQS